MDWPFFDSSFQNLQNKLMRQRNAFNAIRVYTVYTKLVNHSNEPEIISSFL